MPSIVDQLRANESWLPQIIELLLGHTLTRTVLSCRITGTLDALYANDQWRSRTWRERAATASAS